MKFDHMILQFRVLYKSSGIVNTENGDYANSDEWFHKALDAYNQGKGTIIKFLLI